MNLGYYFALLISLVIPLTIFVYVLFKAKDVRKAFIFGILSFSISQLLIRIPLLQYVLADQPWFILFGMKYQVLYLFLLSFTAGLFEETGRYLIFRKFLPNLNTKQIFFFGLGHGGIEAFVLIGLALLSLGSTQVNSFAGFYAGLERISAILLHVSLSFFVYKTISRENIWGYMIALVLHTLFNFGALILILNGVSTLIVELLLLGFAIISLAISMRKKAVYEKNTI